MTAWYLHIYQGQGGVIELPVTKQCYDGTPRSIGAVGSAGCRTCVCIYVYLDEKNCFAAHMSASVWDTDGTNNEEETWCLNEEQGSQLESRIHDKLNADPKLVDLVEAESYQRSEKKAVICCPEQTWDGVKASGAHIITALKAFFALDGIEVQTTHGFGQVHVTNPPTTTYFGYKPSGDTSDSDASNFGHGSGTELWPDFYGWQGVKRVDVNAGTETNRTLSSEWCFVWWEAYGWDEAAGEVPAEFDCLR